MNRYTQVNSCLPADGFALAGLMALEVAFLMVSFQSWKAAIKIPVDGLKFEQGIFYNKNRTRC